MKKKQVELTQEQCQEIIDQMTTRSFYRSDKGNSSDMENLQTMESVGSSIDDILPEPLPSAVKHIQTDTVSPISEETDEVLPTNVVEQQPPTPPIQRRVSSKQRKLSLEEYRNTFMRPYKIEDRKPVFISGKLRKMLDKFACKIGEDRMSMSGLLENIVRHHIELYSEDFEHWKGM
ncbi:DUF3408 domain-containing protein [Bacteroides caccae]|nr:DUF3408 domain-containing protein [Bacteroides caccae]MCF2606778.1 DUF3408 domain-containing protein [Phocaeicola vulgatus]MBV3650022.1 DUF3408 domain-containing protein [Bacteroides caccae]MBV3674080.1 DUF3408 domain-containing protein [Bacteroides caccae]MBV3681412.1 DUF3408 domain-containing protein [Bacteroides caccae]